MAAKLSLEREIAKWMVDRSNGDPPNLLRAIWIDCGISSLPRYRFGAVGIRQSFRAQERVVIASVASGATVEKAIRAMLKGYWEKVKP